MNKPKTKHKAPPPKTINRSIRTPKGVKTGVNKTTEGIHKIDKANKLIQREIPNDQRSENAENYATDNVSASGEYAAQKTINEVKKGGKHGYDKIREHQEIRKQDKFNQRFDNAVKKSKTKAQAQYQAKKTSEKTAQSVTQNSNSKIRHKGGKKTAKSAIHTGKKTKRSIKATEKGVKKTQKSVKATKKGIKTAAKASKSVATAAKRAAVAAKRSAIATARAVQTAVKALIVAIKAAIAAIKGLVTAIAAGGWVAVVVIILVAVIIAVVSSPLAIFTNESDGTTPTISDVVQEINGEYTSKISNIITNAGEIDEIIVEGESASHEFYVSNWIDIIGIFSVKSTVTSSEEEYIPIIYMENRQINDLKNIFWSMNIISYEIIEEVIEPDPTPTPTQSPEPTPTPNSSPTPSPEPTPEPTPEIYRTLIISIESKTYEDGIAMYNLSDKQIEVLYELMTPDYLPMFMEICGMDSYIGLTPEQMNNLINDLPEGELGSVIVEYAISRLGHPYSQSMRGQGDYVDCSYLARWCYQQAGVSRFTAGTAAEQTRYCVNNGLCISYSDLQPGDLIFWSFNVNGRFMNVGHVGIYAGNGYVIDASSSRGMVVYRPIFGQSSIVDCGRPHVLN